MIFFTFFEKNLLFYKKFYNIAITNTKKPLFRRKYGTQKVIERFG